MTRSRRLTLEALEDRTAPAVYGVPWSDPRHLTLSFAPDGTSIGSQASTLFSVLNAQEPTAAWQTAVLRAVQTWAVNTKLNVGVVPDGGEPLGIPSLGQGDSRFGDIRIGAVPLSSTVLAISIPHDPYLSGSWSGDVILNSTIDFTAPQTNLYGVLLHEFGHVFGLGPSTDPASVMYQNATWVTTQLAPSDVAAIKKLYGRPTMSEDGGHTFQTATPMQYSSDDGPVAFGTIPLFASGGLAVAGQNDVYSVQTSAYAGPMTFRLQTGGISVLAPELIVYDATGNVVGQAQSTNVLGDMVTVHLDGVAANSTYYVRVESATSGLFAVGRYGLAVTYDATLQSTPSQVAALLSGTHDDGYGGDYSDDAPPGTVVALRTTPGYAANQHYEIRGSVHNTVTYSLLAPQSPSGAPLVLTVAVSATEASGVLPQLQLLDANQQPVAAEVLVNGGGYTIQATGLAPGQTYYLKFTLQVSGEEAHARFSAVADFTQTPSLLPALAADSVTTAAPQPAYALYVALDQVFLFTLSATGVGAPAGSAVQMTITDANGNVVFSLLAPAGQMVTGPRLLLGPGAYTVHFTAVTPGGMPGSLAFQLFGGSITDPIGPVITDPTDTPMYTNPGNPFTYIYPNGTVSLNPYLLAGLVL
jgi:hypothetical protein